MAAIDPLQDERLMRSALGLAQRGLGQTWPNPSVGCLIVRNEGTQPIIFGRGWTQPGGRPHAEPVAIADGGNDLRGATAYVTLEPCAHFGKTGPCSQALAEAGIARVVTAMEDPDPRVAGRGHQYLRDSGIDLALNVCGDVAARINAGHVTRIRRGRPHVQLKLALSGNGMIGGPGRSTVRITNEKAWRNVHMMRAEADAILVGIGTALADDPELTCRLPGMARRSPVRIVLDSHLQLPLRSKLAQSARRAPVWVIAKEDAPADKRDALEARGCVIIRVPFDDIPLISLPFALAELAGRGVTRLMVEGGSRLAASLIRGNLVDEAVLFEAPQTHIADGVRALDGLDISSVMEQERYRMIEEVWLGSDRKKVFWRET